MLGCLYIHLDMLTEARKVFDLTSAGIGLIRELSEERGVDCEFENVENLMGAVTENQEARLEAEQKTFAALGLNSTWLSEAELRAAFPALSKCGVGRKAAALVPARRGKRDARHS